MFDRAAEDELRERIGSLIDCRYEITRMIGRGAMADVYAAYDLRADREVAIKILHQALAQSPEAMERFQREARVQEMIQHPNVAALYGGGMTEHDEPYLVVELLHGRSLRRVLRKDGPLPLARAADYCRQALSGLAAIHTMGITHRDLKPANIVIEPVAADAGADARDRVVVIDFGFASLEGAKKLTLQGHVVGSLSYMAPERLRGHKGDERSDVYAMGIIFYELVAGEPPFIADDDYTLIRAHLDTPPVPLSTAAPRANVTPPVEAVIARALEKEPDARPQSAVQMAREIERALESS